MSKMRIGQSTDIHQLANGLPLILGGVKIEESKKGSVAHSDGDVLTHAIIESIIGALSLGDIGKHFSDKEDKNYKRSSLDMLSETKLIMESKKYKVVNIDALVMIEKPMLAKYINLMRKNISECLNISIDDINIKATRGESIGIIGREEGVVAQAITLLEHV